jgi:hypothetical protein
MYDRNGGSPLKQERRPVLTARRSSTSLLAGAEDHFDSITISAAEAWGQSLIAAVNAWEANKRGWRRG